MKLFELFEVKRPYSGYEDNKELADAIHSYMKDDTECTVRVSVVDEWGKFIGYDLVEYCTKYSTEPYYLSGVFNSSSKYDIDLSEQIGVRFSVKTAENIWVQGYVETPKKYSVCYLGESGDVYAISEEDSRIVKVGSNLLNKEGVIQLTNGTFLINKYGKYEPNLSFLNIKPDVNSEWIRVEPSEFNLPKGCLSKIYGTFFTSKKGTKCFRINPNGEHMLIGDCWGGSSNRYYGGTLPEEGALYYRRASSNGGGLGHDYAIYQRDWKYELSEEDI